MIEILLEEYKTLKSEQLSRIKTRDTLIFISLGVFGTLFSYVMSGEYSNIRTIVLLVIPIISFILAWTYVANDEKVSHIGKYIRFKLVPELRKHSEKDESIVLQWEFEHRSDTKRSWRKILQVISDLLTFVLPSVVSVGTYYYILTPDTTKLVQYLTYFDVGLIGFTAWIIIYFDFSERRGDVER